MVSRRLELYSSLLISNLAGLSDLLRRRAQVDVAAIVLTQRTRRIMRIILRCRKCEPEP